MTTKCTNQATHVVTYADDAPEEYLCTPCKDSSKAYWGDIVYVIKPLSPTFKVTCEGELDDS